MRTVIKSMLAILPFVVLFFITYSCEDRYIENYQANVPVYMPYEELRAAVRQQDVRPLVNPGKLYFYGQYIFIVEDRKGFHIINNLNPENPINIGFIEVPGNVDLAVKNEVLYADSYTDLVALDISNILKVKEISREEDVFPYTLPPFNEEYKVAEVDEEKGIVTEWKLEKIKEETENSVSYPIYPWYAWGRVEFDMSSASYVKYNGSASGGETTFGVGGSMARITLVDNVLYALGENAFRIFDISDATNPNYNGIVNVTSGAETVFPYQDYLFVGTQTGMFIYDISTPSNPTYVSNYNHWQSCDPVVVENGYAYVTLRSGTFCRTQQAINELQVINVQDVTNPTLMKSYELHNPHGLGIDNNTLFICDGEEGLKVYDATDKYKIAANKLATFPNIHAFDVIPVNGLLLLIGEDGFHQYSYSNLPEVTYLSSITVEKEESE